MPVGPSGWPGHDPAPNDEFGHQIVVVLETLVPGLIQESTLTPGPAGSCHLHHLPARGRNWLYGSSLDPELDGVPRGSTASMVSSSPVAILSCHSTRS